MIDPILFWNDISLKLVANDHTGNLPVVEQGGPTRTARALAIAHLAMADAFVGIEGGFTSYQSPLPVPLPGASSSAAVGEAARITLLALYPVQSGVIEQGLDAFLPALTGSAASISDGREYGKRVALALLALRTDDGATDNTPYVFNNGAGAHRPDPYHAAQGVLTPNWGKVKTFGIGNVALFRAPAPPLLNSNDYKNNFNEVKAKGPKSGGTRTPDETSIGLYWGYDGAQKLGTPPRLYNQILRVIALSRGNSPVENARLFALVNMSMADAGIQCWESKYFYNLWRPILGIREADAGYGPTGAGDGNSGTAGDPYWQPLGAPATNPLIGFTNFTPNFPAYPSGHATFGGAAFWTIKQFYGTDSVPFEFISDELNGASVDVDGSVRTLNKRSFNKLSKAIKENAESRIFLGVHWRFDADAGVDAGKKIATKIFTTQLL
ncbi:MAG: chloroperoxidase [Acidobacteriota bacterium]